MKLYMKELNNEENEIMSLLKGIPEEDIDHHETDLYLRKTPEVTAKVINKLPDTYKKNVTTFIDDIDHVTWYEIPFVFPRGKRRKHIEEESKQIEIRMWIVDIIIAVSGICFFIAGITKLI